MEHTPIQKPPYRALADELRAAAIAKAINTGYVVTPAQLSRWSDMALGLVEADGREPEEPECN